MKRPPLAAALTYLVLCLPQVRPQEEDPDIPPASTPQFNPIVTALCRAGVMTITVRTQDPFFGIVHAREYRKPGCLSDGTGSLNTTLRIDLIAEPKTENYCGVNVDERTEERSIPIAVRAHRTLELAEDKYYVITCGKSGYRNSRNQTSQVSLMLLHDGRKSSELVYGRPYTLRAEVSNPDGSYDIRVKSCFSFSGSNSSVTLVDEYGCPDKSILSAFRYNQSAGTADASLFSMFKFPDSNRAHFQCDIVLCKGKCRNTCEQSASARSLSQQRQDEGEGILMAATSVFVVEPGDEIYLAATGFSCQTFWMYLAIAFGVLLLVMLLVNIFLCSSVNGTCTRTEIIEKEPSIIDDYDPYKVHWSGSQYGSSDHYAIVHSRPGSRPESRYSQKRHRSGGGQSEYAITGRAGHEVY